MICNVLVLKYIVHAILNWWQYYHMARRPYIRGFSCAYQMGFRRGTTGGCDMIYVNEMNTKGKNNKLLELCKPRNGISKCVCLASANNQSLCHKWITVFTFDIGKYARSPLRIKMICEGHKFLVFLSIPWRSERRRAWWQSLKTKAWRYLSKDLLKHNMAKAVARVVDITHPQGSGCKQLISSW